MKTVAIANPQAGAGRVRRWWEEHRHAVERWLGAVEVRHTAGPGDATRLTREAIDSGATAIVAAGGDGTINEVVNGFFDEKGVGSPDVCLAVFPAGTGGDFVRSIGLADRGGVAGALEMATERLVDVGRARFMSHQGQLVQRYFLNISSFGSSGLIVDKVNRTSKRLGGKASFFVGTVKGLLAYRNQPIKLSVDGQLGRRMTINTVAVANGRYFGGSMKVAPNALLDDGLLDVVVIGDVGLARFVQYSGDLYRGEHIKRPEIIVLRGKTVEAEPMGRDPVLIDLDGEQPGRLPVQYDILPKTLKLLAPWGRAEGVSPGPMGP